MNLFTRKMRLFCVSNIMVSFVCTGFLGIRTTNGIINESTTGEAHEISLTTSDTEPVSHFGEGENSIAFITNSLEAAIKGQEEPVGPISEENEFAFITNSIEAVIAQQESALAEKKEEKKVEKKTTKKTSTKKTTSVVTKKEVAKSSSYTKPSYSSVTGEAVVAFAKQFMGLRYRSGTPSLTKGADCSGFTMLIYREFGVSLPRTVGGQASRGKYVAKKDLQKGDLVFYKAKGAKGGPSHVGIYYGGGQVIHESRPGVGVKLSTVNMMQYVTARRVINSKATQIAEAKLAEQKKNEAATDNTNNTNAGTTTNNESNVNNSVVVSATPTVVPSVSPSATPVPSVTPAPTTPTPTVVATPTPKVETTTENSSLEGSN